MKAHYFINSIVIAVKSKTKGTFRTDAKFLFYILINIKCFTIRCIFFQALLVNDDRKTMKKT